MSPKHSLLFFIRPKTPFPAINVGRSLPHYYERRTGTDDGNGKKADCGNAKRRGEL